MAEALADGAIFATRYRIVRCIAAGGMGAIYEVVHLETERRRALKVMHPHFVDSDDLRDRFKREARVAAQIDSDYIVDVFDAGVDEATKMPFLVMELLKGEELGKALKRVGRFTPQDALNFLWQTALALDKTHKVNIVHRDLKPDNLFLNLRDDGAPRVKVLDFGVAKFVAETGTQANATRSLGTPLYMAPEQFLGKNVSPACDLYALAMMAYTLLTGHPYWEAEAKEAGSVFAFATDVQHGPREPASMRASRFGVQLGGAFDAWFYKATNARAEERYPTATATIAALGEVFGVNPARLVGVAADVGGPVSHGAPYAAAPGPFGGATPVSARSSALPQPGFGPSQSQPGFGPSQSQPGLGAQQSQPGFGPSQSQPGSQTSGAMVAPAAPPRSRVGAIAMVVIGLGVGAGVA
ncbi:MAG TPA: protein kinase, partial [Byssovorax sp.]